MTVQVRMLLLPHKHNRRWPLEEVATPVMGLVMGIVMAVTLWNTSLWVWSDQRK